MKCCYKNLYNILVKVHLIMEYDRQFFSEKGTAVETVKIYGLHRPKGNFM